MKNTLTNIACAAIFTVATFAGGVEAREISHTLKLSEPNKPAVIDIDIMQGDISVRGYKGKDVVIKGKVTALSNKDKETKIVYQYNGDESDEKREKPSVKGLKKISNQSINLEIEEEDNEVSIESPSSRHNIELEIMVPFTSKLEISLNRGKEINIENVHGEIEVEAARAAITAKGIRGPIVAESGRNDVVVEFETFNTEKPSSISVHRGSLDVTLPKKASAEIQVKSYEGDLYSGIDSEFKSIDQVEKGKSSNKQQIVLGGVMAATMNGGKQKIKLNTYRGDVIVRGK